MNTTTYYFNSDEYLAIWGRYNIPRSVEYVEDRIRYWQTNVEPKFNLIYDESVEVGDYDEVDIGWYGLITGAEKDINWFLLSL